MKNELSRALRPSPIILRDSGKPQHVVLRHDQFVRLVELARQGATVTGERRLRRKEQGGYIPLATVGRMIAGKRIAKARRAAGLSQATLGKKVGMPQSQISRIERSPENCTVKTLRKLAKALGVDVARFIE